MRIEIDGVKRRLRGDVEPVPARVAEAKVGDELWNGNPANQGSVRRVSPHGIGAGRPQIAVPVDPEAVEEAFVANRERVRVGERLAVGADRVGVDYLYIGTKYL